MEERVHPAIMIYKLTKTDKITSWLKIVQYIFKIIQLLVFRKISFSVLEEMKEAIAADQETLKLSEFLDTMTQQLAIIQRAPKLAPFELSAAQGQKLLGCSHCQELCQQENWPLIGCTRVHNQSEARSGSWHNSWHDYNS